MKHKNAILLAAKLSGLFLVSRLLTKRWVRILAYHGVWLGDGHFGNFLFMQPDKFHRRMNYLKDSSYPVVALQDLINTDGSVSAMHYRCPVVITIDDGWYGTSKAMLPVLKDLQLPAILYLTTYYCLNQKPVINVKLQYLLHRWSREFSKVEVKLAEIEQPLRVNCQEAFEHTQSQIENVLASAQSDDERQAIAESIAASLGINTEDWETQRWFHLMNPDEVESAAGSGLRVELHTHRHRMEGLSAEEMAADLGKNRQAIHKIAGQHAVHLCYPSGRYSEAWFEALEKCEVLTATTTDIGLVRKSAHRYQLPRILDGQGVSDIEFQAELSGFMEVLRVIRSFVIDITSPARGSA